MKLSAEAHVVLMGHPLLFQEQPQVTLDEIATSEFQDNLDALRQIQIKSNGIGIAAPQAGWPARVISIGASDENLKRYPDAEHIPFNFWVNPQVTETSANTCWAWEGCLSVPGIRGWVERPESITIVGYDHSGQRQEAVLTGFHARVMQHELDHLNGILYPTRVEDKSLLIPEVAMANQNEWSEDWPTPGARVTPGGVISQQR